METPGSPVSTLFQRLADPASSPVDRCQVCRYVMCPPIPDELKGKVPQLYICRRLPPVLTLLAVPAPMPANVILKKNESPPVTFANQSIQPQTTPDGWCGEFRAQVK